MSVKLHALLNAPVIELDSIDSTNNYAMQLIDADTAQPGLTIVTQQQTAGKGQRGRKWVDATGESVLMSLVLSPEQEIEQQFSYNVLLTLAISDYLQSIYEHWDIRIKWPNDIIINDKKAGGVLIENVIRGNNWAYCVVGLGVNVLQKHMPEDLPYATSLFLESSKQFNVHNVMTEIRSKIFKYLTSETNRITLLEQYNASLFRKDQFQRFKISDTEFTATVIGAMANGMLQLQHDNGDIINYNHGAVEWFWG